MSAPQLTQYIQGQGAVTADGLNTFLQTTGLVADLRAFVGTVGMQVFCRGQSVVNDGGQGNFYWNALGVAPDDGVNVIVPFGSATGEWQRMGGALGIAQYTSFTGGSGAFVVPAGARQLYIRMIGGGGAGAQSSLNGQNGNAGTATVFSAIVANPGQGGTAAGIGGAGGVSGAGAAYYRAQGTYGFAGVPIGGAGQPTSGSGGLPGGGFFGSQISGSPGPANTGAGGQGGAGSSFVGSTGGGGGAGEYAEIVISSPIGPYSYSVGVGGTVPGGGAFGFGFNGGSGVILITTTF